MKGHEKLETINDEMVNDDIKRIVHEEYITHIDWSGDVFEDYKKLALNYEKCGLSLFVKIIQEMKDIKKNEINAWTLSTIYLMRHCIELTLKCLICKSYSNNKELQKKLIDCKHDVVKLYQAFNIKVLLSKEEENWIKKYLESVNNIDKKSDTFRYAFGEDFFPNIAKDDFFSDDLFEKIINEKNYCFIDIINTARNFEQSLYLLKKLGNIDVNEKEKFHSNAKPKFLVFCADGLHNCNLWEFDGALNYHRVLL